MRESDAGAVAELVRALSDRDRAESPRTFPSDRDTTSHAGLYSWWADAEARTLIGRTLEIEMPDLIYAGQAGATRWPSGTKSTATLATRIRGNHINGNASSSTFRLTISAVLLDPLALTVAKPGRLTSESNRAVSDWIKAHLRVAVAADPDRDTLGRIEDAVLDILDPPLNIRGRPATKSRAMLAFLRSKLRSWSEPS